MDEEIRIGSGGCCVVVARLLFQSNEGVGGRRSNETRWGGVELSEGDESGQDSRPGRAVYNGSPPGSPQLRSEAWGVGLEMSRGQHDIRMSDRHHNSSGRAEGTALLLGDDGHL